MTTQNRQRSGPNGHDVNALQRAQEAMKLRKIGWSYEEIAKQCGYADRAACWNAIHRVLARMTQEAANDLRVVEAQRLDDMMRAFMLRAMKGEKDAALVVLRIMERRAKLLGLDMEAELASVQDLRREYYGVNVVEAASSNGHQLPTSGVGAGLVP